MTPKKNGNSMRSQIVLAIQSDIFQNREVGEKLPSETEYARLFNVARTTVQKALNDVSEMNLIHRIQGKGSFVAMKQPRVKLFNFKGFSDYARQIGAEPVSQVISKKVKGNGTEKFLVLKRLRLIRNHKGTIPLTLDQSTLSLNRFPGLDQFDFEKESLYETLRQQYEAFPTNTSLKMSAISANEQTASLFGCKLHDPLLQADGVVVNRDNQTLEKVTVIYSEHAEFNLTLGI